MQQRLVNGVARCASHSAHHRALTSDELVKEARLTDVWSPNDRDGHLALNIGAARIFWKGFESLNNDVEQVARTDPVLSAHRMQAIKAESRELLRCTIAFNIVRLIRHQDDWLAATA